MFPFANSSNMIHRVIPKLNSRRSFADADLGNLHFKPLNIIRPHQLLLLLSPQETHFMVAALIAHGLPSTGNGEQNFIITLKSFAHSSLAFHMMPKAVPSSHPAQR